MVIVILGPAGAGKSRLALEVSLVPHHLINIMHASEDCLDGMFLDDVRRATPDVLGRGCVPVVVGGTELYLMWFIYSKLNVPQSSMEITPSVWSELAGFRESGWWEEAVDLVLKTGDPKAQDLQTNNWVRLHRRLEIIRSSGSPSSAFTLHYSSFQEQHNTKITGSSVDDGTCEVNELEYDFLCIFLACPRVELYMSIDLRCEEMLADIGVLVALLMAS
ncbi:hypothetical protein ACQ4PT_011922 [Festuca glaucescens]